MGHHLSSAESDWINELAASWLEVYKKSATTRELLLIIQESGPVAAAEIRTAFQQGTGWDITERGLYRTLKRLGDQGLLSVTAHKIPGSGAKRKDFTLTPAGRKFLELTSLALASSDKSHSS